MLDLFSGIGGFSLAARWTGQIKTVQFVEIDKFCQKILKKNFPGVPIYDDIKTFTKDTIGTGTGDNRQEIADERRRTGEDRREGLRQGNGTAYTSRSNATNKHGVDILCGGFPCQPASVAGDRKGTSDNRWLWPEMFRVITEVKPAWCVLENVPGLLTLEQGLVFENCCLALESEGYEVQPFIIPACAVNAPHRRDRVWIIAHTGCKHGTGTEITGKFIRQIHGEENASMLKRSISHVADTNRFYGNDAGFNPGEVSQFKTPGILEMQSITNSGNERLEGGERHRTHEQKTATHGSTSQRNYAWDEDWLEVASRLCQLYDGLPYGLVGCLTLTETHGIMGFILMLRRYHYATSEETRTREILPVLQQAFGEESVQRCFGRLSKIFKTEDLWCPVHGKVDGERKEDHINASQNGSEISKKELRKMSDNTEPSCSSYRRERREQCTCEFDDIVRELSSEIALGEWKNNTEKAHYILYNMWQESRGKRFLHEPLSAIHEVWRSVTDKEIGSFRQHYNKRNKFRTQKLKALGNTIVPQIAYQIFMAILEVEFNKDGIEEEITK
jgi:DNA-cytosine methyltransferase